MIVGGAGFSPSLAQTAQLCSNLTRGSRERGEHAPVCGGFCWHAGQARAFDTIFSVSMLQARGLHITSVLAISTGQYGHCEPKSMNFHTTETARDRVLRKLGLARLVSATYLDIEAGHRAHAELQRVPATFEIDGLTIAAPAGVYHPTPESSSLLSFATSRLSRRRRSPECWRSARAAEPLHSS